MQTTAFPELELTEYEKNFWSIYGSDKKPGVLNRIYKRTINSSEQPDANLPKILLSAQLQLSRRARIYALTFNGNVDRWRLNISNASGTGYTQKTPRSQLDPVVSSLFAGSFGSGAALGGLTPPITPLTTINDSIGPSFNFNPFVITTWMPFPLLIEPNWLMMPNETLILNGTPINISINGEEDIVPNLVLNIGIYVWEFPEPNAEKVEAFNNQLAAKNK